MEKIAFTVSKQPSVSTLLSREENEGCEAFWRKKSFRLITSPIENCPFYKSFDFDKVVEYRFFCDHLESCTPQVKLNLNICFFNRVFPDSWYIFLIIELNFEF